MAFKPTVLFGLFGSIELFCLSFKLESGQYSIWGHLISNLGMHWSDTLDWAAVVFMIDEMIKYFYD